MFATLLDPVPRMHQLGLRVGGVREIERERDREREVYADNFRTFFVAQELQQKKWPKEEDASQGPEREEGIVTMEKREEIASAKCRKKEGILAFIGEREAEGIAREEGGAADRTFNFTASRKM